MIYKGLSKMKYATFEKTSRYIVLVFLENLKTINLKSSFYFCKIKIGQIEEPFTKFF